MKLHVGLCLVAVGLGSACRPVSRGSLPQETSLTASRLLMTYNDTRQEWTLQNRAMEITIGFTADGDYALKSLRDRTGGTSWVADPLPLLAHAVEVEGHPVRLRLRAANPMELAFQNYRIEEAAVSSTLSIAFKNANTVVTHSLCVYEDSPVVESSVRVRNGGGGEQTLTRLKSLTLQVAAPGGAVECHTVTGIQGHLPYDQRIPHPAFRVETKEVPVGGGLTVPSGPRSSELNLDWFGVFVPGEKAGLFGGFAWSGQRTLDLARDPQTLTLESGMDGFRHTLAPGESLESPKAVLGVFAGDVNEGTVALAEFARRHLMPDPPPDFPWFMYNTWFCLGVNQDEATVRADLDACAEIGVEGIYLDAGWFAQSPKEENKYEFSGGLGYWKENREKYPSGIRALSDYTHSKNMKFGLWVEPERVSENTRGLDPDGWTNEMLVTRAGNLIEPPCRVRSYMVCLGNPSAREWVYRSLCRMIEDYRVDWVKWDNNVWGTCDRADHGHQAGDGNWAQIRGLYEVLDHLRARYPTLVVENCASGGNRMDLGLLRRTHVFWIHDDSFTSYVNRFHVYGTSFHYPAHYLNSWVIDGGDFAREKPPISDRAVKSIFRSRMLGAAGISLTVRDWSPEVKRQVRREIEFYKQNRRFLFGDLYRLTPQTVIYNKTWEAPTQWEMFQYFLPELRESMIYCFREEGDQTRKALIPRCIEKDKRYQVRFVDAGTQAALSGEEILTGKLEVALPQPFSSEVVFVSEM